METILKQDKNKSNVEFEKLLSKDLDSRNLKEGSIVTSTVSSISKKHVWVELSAKSEGAIPIEEFKLAKEIDKIAVGTKVDVFLENIENRSGEVVVSREKARRAKAWKKMEKAFESKEEVTGIILSRCKGGFVVSVDSCLCFLPASQLDLRPLKKFDHLMKVPQTFECVKLDKRRGNIVLSRRAVIEKIRNKDRDKIMANIKVGDIVNGTVKNLTDFGAFIDLQGVDGLLHITKISWSRINKPSDVLSLGQTCKVLITEIDDSTKKISCSIKDLTENPWLSIVEKYKIGKQYEGVVTRVMDYGVFCKLDENVEGLIHSSQLSWVKKSIHPGKILSVSQKIFCEVLEIDKDKKRLSLSYRNCIENPWVVFTKENKVGDVLMGTLKSVVDYGIFISINDKKGVPTGLDGLCHYKDVNYSEKESELERFKKGQTVKFKVLDINTKDDKIRLGIKQLEDDSFNFFRHLQVGDIVTSVVHSSSQNGVYVNVGKKNFSVLIKKNQLAKEPENQRPQRFVPGDKLDATITELEKDKRKVVLSVKRLEETEQRKQIKKFGSKDSGGVLGEILGPLLNKKKTKNKKK